MAPEQRATVLIVEDDLGLARLVRVRLERAGYAVETATTAEEGMERMRRGGVDLLVIDQRLPTGLSGLQLYDRVKEAGIDVPAILATGFQRRGHAAPGDTRGGARFRKIGRAHV